MKDDPEYEVVWSGGPLLPPRPENQGEVWTPRKKDKRKYTRKQNPQPTTGGQTNGESNV